MKYLEKLKKEDLGNHCIFILLITFLIGCNNLNKNEQGVSSFPLYENHIIRWNIKTTEFGYAEIGHIEMDFDTLFLIFVTVSKHPGYNLEIEPHWQVIFWGASDLVFDAENNKYHYVGKESFSKEFFMERGYNEYSIEKMEELRAKYPSYPKELPHLTYRHVLNVFDLDEENTVFWLYDTYMKYVRVKEDFSPEYYKDI